MRNAILGVLFLTAMGCDHTCGVPGSGAGAGSGSGKEWVIYRLQTSIVEDDSSPAAQAPPPHTVGVFVLAADRLNVSVPTLRPGPIVGHAMVPLSGDASDDQWHCGTVGIDTMVERRDHGRDLPPAIIDLRATQTYSDVPRTDTTCSDAPETWPAAGGHTVADLRYDLVEQCGLGCNALATVQANDGSSQVTCGCPPSAADR